MHGGWADVAAVLGALGAPLVLVARRPLALVGGIALVGGAEVLLAYANTGGGRVSAAVIAAGAVALVLIAGAGYALVRFPALVIPLVLLAAPFRLPLDFSRRHRFFVAVAEGGQLGRLLPLYVVLAAAVAALLYRLARGGELSAPLPRAIAWPAGAFLALASLSLLWSRDLAAGVNLLEFFLLPFALLVAVVARAPFPAWLPRTLASIAVALGCVFAGVGVWEASSHRLLFFAPKLEVANSYASFFRVTSLFRDPSLYGRHVVLAMTVVLVPLWLRRLNVVAAGGLLALLWAGLYFSYSQSSLAALFVIALAVPAFAGGQRARLVVLAGAAAVVLAAAGVGAAELRDHTVQRATSDRSRRVELTARAWAERPLVGVGIGGQPRASQQLAKRYSPRTNFVSHTTPLTVAAELGALGFLLYAALLAGAAKAIDAVRRRDAALGLTLAAALLALFVHALFYSGFFEDPLTWLMLGVTAAALAVPRPEPERLPVPPTREPVLAT